MKPDTSLTASPDVQAISPHAIDPEVIARLPDTLRPLAIDLPTLRLGKVLDLLDRRIDDIVVVAESIHRRHNLSAIIRSAEAFGLHEAWVIGEHFRAATGPARGAERWMVIQAAPTPADLFPELVARGMDVYIAEPEEGAILPEEVPLDRPLAVVFGSEWNGVSPEARALAKGVIQIPLYGLTHSLNVSVASGLILHTLTQRRRALRPVTGIQGDARWRFVADFLVRERARRGAYTALWEGEEDP